jgi:hypothetical protein
MTNKLKPLFMIAVLISIASLASAQDQNNSSPVFLINTNPGGATVYLNGEHSLIANTPAQLPSNLSGRYRTKIIRAGYESWKGELTFVPGTSNNFNIELKRKTRLKAGLRSLLLPGWGQFYSGNTGRGSIMTLSIVLEAGGLYMADQRYQDKRADYDIASQNYANATSIEERLRLKTVKDSRQRLAYKAESNRRNIFYIGIGMWAYNFLDAVIFFPEFGSFSPTVSAIDGGAKLTLIARF